MARAIKGTPWRVDLTGERREKVAAILHDILPLGDEPQVPIELTGTLNGRFWRRIRAVYGDGWVMIVNFDRKGQVSSASAKKSLGLIKARG